MSTTLYPSSLAELDRWRVENSTTLDEARNGNPRSTIDLDFTAGDAFSDEEEEIRTRLDVAIRIVVRRLMGDNYISRPATIRIPDRID